ncbi:MAG: hypothetical protein FJ215_09745 [Ignavibacteria bacterium]|nr:hypothetical protein [Ignavibacteria bacterium]
MSAFLDCLKQSLLEIIGISLVVAILEIIKRRGFSYLAEKTGKEILKKLLARFLPRLTWIGQALLVAAIILMILECANLLP